MLTLLLCTNCITILLRFNVLLCTDCTNIYMYTDYGLLLCTNYILLCRLTILLHTDFILMYCTELQELEAVSEQAVHWVPT